MLGAIIGDIAGSIYEFHPWNGEDRDMPILIPGSFFTDDTVLTVALADAIMENTLEKKDIAVKFHQYGKSYPGAGYGGMFRKWLAEKSLEGYGSFGNGGAMRVSPAGWACETLEETRELARKSAMVTHDHPEGIAGACSVAEAIYLARNGASKEEIKKAISEQYGYDLDRTLKEIRDSGYGFSECARDTVPEAIIAFLESENFEQAIQNAIWLRGDADTQAAIAGSIAEAFYGVPEDMEKRALRFLDAFLADKVKNWQKRGKQRAF